MAPPNCVLAFLRTSPILLRSSSSSSSSSPPPSAYQPIPPYFHTFRTGAKKRWQGKKLFEVLKKEISFPDGYFERAFEFQRIRVNQVPVGLNYSVREGDIIEHICHIHEPIISPPPSSPLPPPIKILHNGEEVLVVHKPAGIPVFPTGFFRKTSLLEQVKREVGGGFAGEGQGGSGRGSGGEGGQDSLFPVHRIDREVSGLVIFARSKKKAREFAQLFSSQSITKEYICLVEGDFPSNLTDFNSVLTTSITTNQITPCTLELDKHQSHIFKTIHPSIPSSPTLLGFSLSLPLTTCYQQRKQFAIPLPNPTTNPISPKETITDFFRLGYERERNCSLVLARPHQGRLHQIRAHLGALGFPIVRDEMYAPSPRSCSPSSPSSPSLFGKNQEDGERDMGVCPICRGEDTVRDASSDYICLHGWRYFSSSPPSSPWSFCNNLPHWVPSNVVL